MGDVPAHPEGVGAAVGDRIVDKHVALVMPIHRRHRRIMPDLDADGAVGNLVA